MKQSQLNRDSNNAARIEEGAIENRLRDGSLPSSEGYGNSGPYPWHEEGLYMPNEDGHLIPKKTDNIYDQQQEHQATRAKQDDVQKHRHRSRRKRSKHPRSANRQPVNAHTSTAGRRKSRKRKKIITSSGKQQRKYYPDHNKHQHQEDQQQRHPYQQQFLEPQSMKMMSQLGASAPLIDAGPVRITISSKLAPRQKMRMVVKQNAFGVEESIDAMGIRWESFLSGVRERLGIAPQLHIKVYDSVNAEIRSVEDIVPGDDLIIVPTSKRQHEVSLMQHPAPHPQHHKIVSSIIHGPNGVGLTTFFNSRKQITDVPNGVKKVDIPTWEKESRKTPQERRWDELREERKRNMIGVEANFARGGSMGLNTYFNSQEQEDDKNRGVKRHPFASRSRGSSLDFAGLGTEIGLKMHELNEGRANKRRHHIRGIRRITTMSRERWKDMDPNNLPEPPPSSRKASPRMATYKGAAGNSGPSVRIPGLPFPNEPLPGEDISEWLSNASTLSTECEGIANRQHTPLQPGSPRGKRHFHKGQSTCLTHRRLVARNARLTEGYFQGEVGYDPMRTNVGSLLGSSK